MHLLLIWKKLSIFTCHLLEGISKENSKTTIDYNDTKIKVQLSYITVVNDSKTHSKRPACINDSGRYYIVLALSG